MDPNTYIFDGFALTPHERRLVHSDQPVLLAPKTLDTLIILVQNAGKLLSKEALHRSLWPDTFVGDVTLARNISDLRATLARYSEVNQIETVSKHGYRFTGEVEVNVSANKGHPPQTEAWHAVWQGRLHQRRFTVHDLAKAETCFENAISLDPNSALPYLSLAENQHIKANLALVRPSDVLPKAAEAIAQALRLDGTSGEVHAAAGVNEVFWRYKWAQAETHFRSALALSPSVASVHHLYALWWLRPQGRFAEAISQNQLALDLDPLSPFLRVVQAYLFYLAGDDRQAIALCHAALKFDENNFLAHRIWGHVLQKQGRIPEAHNAYTKAAEFPGISPVELGYLGISFALLGDMKNANTIRDQLQSSNCYRSPAIMALLDFTCGRTEAYRWMNQAVDDRDPNLFTIASDPQWLELRKSPEGKAVLRRIHFSPSETRPRF